MTVSYEPEYWIVIGVDFPLSQGKTGILPANGTSFVGRREVGVELERLVSTARLVTLTGPGGVGKSRLAVRVSDRLRRVFDHVFLVDLADLRDGSLLAYAVADDLGLGSTPLESVLLSMAENRLLLVLDHCEHLLDACGELVDSLLPAAPRLHVLATSREPLGIEGEHVRPIRPMAVADGSDAAEPCESVELFRHRASAVRPGFVVTSHNEGTVARLCRRLDGLPLAIELAAARMRGMTAGEVLSGLDSVGDDPSAGDDRSARILRDVVAWTYGLCSRQEVRVWARASVFVGGFTLAAAEQVCGDDDVAPGDVFAMVAGLVEKSILTRDGARYRMHKAVRAHGWERLAIDGEEMTFRRRHRDYYLGLVDQADTEWFGPRQSEWSATLRREQANLWAALEFCLSEPGGAPRAMSAAATLWSFWSSSGSAAEGRHWLVRTLAAEATGGRERAKALWANGYLAVVQGHIADGLDAALPVLTESRALAQRIGDRSALAYATQFTGVVALIANDLDSAAELLDEALTLQRSEGKPRELAVALFYNALVKCLRAEIDQAMALAEECREICVSHGEQWCQARAHWVLGQAWRHRGDLDRATAHVFDCIRLQRRLNDRAGLACCVEFLGWVACAQGDPARAARLLGTSQTMWDGLGRFMFGVKKYQQWHAECEQATREALGCKGFEKAFREGAGFTFDATLTFVLGEDSSGPQ